MASRTALRTLATSNSEERSPVTGSYRYMCVTAGAPSAIHKPPSLIQLGRITPLANTVGSSLTQRSKRLKGSDAASENGSVLDTATPVIRVLDDRQTSLGTTCHGPYT